MRAVQALDHADTPARIARQTRMRRRMNVFGAHAIADFESRGRRRWPPIGASARHFFYISEGERPTGEILRGAQRAPGGDLVGIDETALDQQLLITQKPLLVVGAR